MQEWFMEEWNCVMKGFQYAEDENIEYQMTLRIIFLTRLCFKWQDKLHEIPSHKVIPFSWGPSLEQLTAAQSEEITEMTDEKWEIDFDSDSEDGEEEDRDETELIEAMEELALSDEFRTNYVENYY